MGRSIYELRQLPVAGDSGFAAGVAVGSLVGVVPTVNLPSYAAYTPAWTSSGTAPAIGNATVMGRYIQVGEFVHAQVGITFGSSSTYGTGVYSFTLPVTGSLAGVGAIGSARLFDASTGNLGLASCDVASTTTILLSYSATHLGSNTSVGQLAPWTWAQTDVINFNVWYEAA